MATIKKSDFAEYVRERFGFPLAVSGNIVEVIFGEIVESLKRGEPVKISNFGTFDISDKAERVGRNPKTGRPAVISARRVPTFRASQEFKEKFKTDSK